MMQRYSFVWFTFKVYNDLKFNMLSNPTSGDSVIWSWESRNPTDGGRLAQVIDSSVAVEFDVKFGARGAREGAGAGGLVERSGRAKAGGKARGRAEGKARERGGAPGERGEAGKVPGERREKGDGSGKGRGMGSGGRGRRPEMAGRRAGGEAGENVRGEGGGEGGKEAGEGPGEGLGAR